MLDKKSKLLLSEISENFFNCSNSRSYTEHLQKVKSLISYKASCSALFVLEDSGIVRMQKIVWFREIPKLQRFWLTQKLYEVDPVIVAALQEMKAKKRSAKLVWSEVYLQAFKDSNSKVTEFLSKMISFSMNYAGCSYIFQIDPSQYFLFGYTGESIEIEDSDIEEVLIPAMAMAYEQITIRSEKSWFYSNKQNS